MSIASPGQTLARRGSGTCAAGQTNVNAAGITMGAASPARPAERPACLRQGSPDLRSNLFVDLVDLARAQVMRVPPFAGRTSSFQRCVVPVPEGHGQDEQCSPPRRCLPLPGTRGQAEAYSHSHPLPGVTWPWAAEHAKASAPLMPAWSPSPGCTM